jgi:hypothetical protein
MATIIYKIRLISFRKYFILYICLTMQLTRLSPKRMLRGVRGLAPKRGVRGLAP